MGKSMKAVELPAIPQREAANKRCPSVLLDWGIDEMTEEIGMTFCGPISGKEACRYSPERQERSGGGTEQRGRPKTVTRDLFHFSPVALMLMVPESSAETAETMGCPSLSTA